MVKILALVEPSFNLYSKYHLPVDGRSTVPNDRLTAELFETVLLPLDKLAVLLLLIGLRRVSTCVGVCVLVVTVLLFVKLFAGV